MEKALVEVEDLSYSYPGRDKPALSGVSMELFPGEFVLLLGASGSGKSTLCRSLNGLVPHFYGGKIWGRVRVAGTDTVSAEVRELSRRVGMVFQDPENQLVTESPESEIAFGLENIGLDPVTMRKRVEEVLATLRLGDITRKRTSEISSGQKQKVALASVLVMHPEVLVLDEPTSQLDPISADDFLATLKSLNDDLGLSVLVAEHRIERCFHFADRVILLEDGKVAFTGKPAELAAWSRGDREIPLPPVTRLFAGFDGIPPITVKQARERIAALAGVASPGSRAAFETPIEAGVSEPEPGAKPLVQVSKLWHVYEDGTEALRGVDLDIFPGEFVAVIGENGSGKSTLVKHFNGLLKPGQGKVLLDGLDTRKNEVARLARTCGMLGQNPNLQLICDTCEEELATTLKAMDIDPRERDRMIEDVLELLDLGRFRGENPQDLSCGERERVALASVLVYSPELLVLDEPTRGVDHETKERLARYLREYHSRGKTVVLVTHDLELAAECCERVLLMGRGRILADGDKHRVLSESLFFTTQFNKCFRGVSDGVVTEAEARRALEVLS